MCCFYTSCPLVGKINQSSFKYTLGFQTLVLPVLAKHCDRLF